MPTRLGDLHDVPHELEGLLRKVDAVLGIAVSYNMTQNEKSRQHSFLA